MNLREYLKTNTLIFDGGMGTYYAARNRSSHVDCEWANLTNPDEVAAIHRAYLDAGCQAIKTNTYCVNRLNYSESDCKLLLRSGFEIATRNGADSVMTTYGIVNGIHTSSSYDLCTTILRDDWGFKGIVIRILRYYIFFLQKINLK